MKISEIEGIGEIQGEKLAAAGVETTEKLLELAGDARGREVLAAATGHLRDRSSSSGSTTPT